MLIGTLGERATRRVDRAVSCSMLIQAAKPHFFNIARRSGQSTSALREPHEKSRRNARQICQKFCPLNTDIRKRLIAEQDCSKPEWENDEPAGYCEPDDEDIAYMIAQEREVASLRSEYHDADRQLRNYQKHTDRQLRALSKEKKDCARDLAQAHQFDVVSDS